MSDRGDGTTKKQTTLSLPPELVDEIDEFADESHLSSRSKTVELLARDGLEQQRTDEDEGGGVDDRPPSMVEVLAQPRVTAIGLGLLALAFVVLAVSAFVFSGAVSMAAMFAATGVLAASPVVLVLNYAAHTAMVTTGQPTRRSSSDPQEGAEA